MEEELRDLLVRNRWNELFESIRRDSLGHDFSRAEAAKPENRGLNRYRDVYPYDHSRVRLEDHPATDYINASLVKAPRANRKYILAQGPLAATVGHFWLLVWQQQSRAVLMLNRVMEKGQLKCHQYWPMEENDEMIFEDVGLKLENIHSVPGDHYTSRTLRLSQIGHEGESRDILHFHYTTWPDFGVPQCPDTFLEFLRAVRESGSLDPAAGPPVVHCSAGIGRSGSFCLVDTCLVLVTKEGPENVCIRDVLLELRNYRMGLIQTPDQLKFSYLAIATGAHEDGLISEKIWNDCQDVSEEISSNDSDGSDCVPPPLPPRSESLKLQEKLHSLLKDDSSTDPTEISDPPDSEAAAHSENVQVNGNGEHSSGVREPSPHSLNKNSVTTSGASQLGDINAKTDSPNKCILNNHKMEERKREMEMRRRKKEAARIHTEQLIQEIKRKTREVDEKQQRRSKILENIVPFCVGFVMFAAGTYFYWKS